MRRQRKTVRELQDMLLAELNDSSVKVVVSFDPLSGAWRAMSVGDTTLDIVGRVQQIAERLRVSYDCIEDRID
jgi:hypothetical protein